MAVVSDTSTRERASASKRRRRRKPRKRVRQETGQEQESSLSETSSGEETETETPVETCIATSAVQRPSGNPDEGRNCADEEEAGDPSDVQAAVAESVVECFGESGRGLVQGSGPAVLPDSAQSDWYSSIDGLLLRAPSGRAPLRVDHRGPARVTTGHLRPTTRPPPRL